eukprot:scaffold3475_cov246-Prasinococcus_capsulatus_cf.AAC.5
MFDAPPIPPGVARPLPRPTRGLSIHGEDGGIRARGLFGIGLRLNIEVRSYHPGDLARATPTILAKHV